MLTIHHIIHKHKLYYYFIVLYGSHNKLYRTGTTQFIVILLDFFIRAYSFAAWPRTGFSSRNKRFRLESKQAQAERCNSTEHTEARLLFWIRNHRPDWSPPRTSVVFLFFGGSRICFFLNFRANTLWTTCYIFTFVCKWMVRAFKHGSDYTLLRVVDTQQRYCITITLPHCDGRRSTIDDRR